MAENQLRKAGFEIPDCRRLSRFFAGGSGLAVSRFVAIFNDLDPPGVVVSLVATAVIRPHGAALCPAYLGGPKKKANDLLRLGRL
jgi:hypothetical protein